MLSKFPKQRNPLPPEYRAIYESYYSENRSGWTAASGAARRMERWLHGNMAADASPEKVTLEIGAGNLNHLPFEPNTKSYDIVEPMAFLYEASPNLPRIRNVFASIHDIPDGQRYDRIMSCGVMEHVCDLPDLVSKAGKMLNPGGRFTAAIPSEGGMLWKVGWMMTTGLEFRLRHKLDYSVIMQHEHVNTAAEIENVIRHFFEDVSVASFGLGRQLSLYQFIEARLPKA